MRGARPREETVGDRERKGTAKAFAADVTRASACAAMEEAVSRWGGLDILHNNVGIESRLDLMETTEQEWDRVMAIDLKSMLLATQAAVPAMEKAAARSPACPRSRRWSAMAAPPTPRPRPASSASSPASRCSWPKGIRVNAIAPGQVWTPMVERLGAEARERRKKASPLGTEGTGWDVGWGAVYLASDEAVGHRPRPRHRRRPHRHHALTAGFTRAARALDPTGRAGLTPRSPLFRT